jgi:7,8-didemethyl-8-hydroxy-5-deazariboflavin synthase CofH subunit
MSELDGLMLGVRGAVRRILEACLEGRELGWEDAVELLNARGRDAQALCMTADELRRRQVGDVVTYVINRNINFTNVCVKTCRFCAFARGARSEEGYFLGEEEVARRAAEAHRLGATEVCLQAGLAPSLNGSSYVDLCRAVKRAAPALHIHAFSPEEVKYGSALARLSIRDFLIRLKEAGLDSLPGTSAEILDEEVRQRISPRRIRVAEWIEVVSTAHALGIPTTSTMMFGHVETAVHRARHLELLRSIQRSTAGFTEFVPLSFVHTEAPLFNQAVKGAVSAGPSSHEVVTLYAVSRLMLGSSIPNIQCSWVKEGPRLLQLMLDAGVNDVGGTLMNESISTSAGARHGQMMSPAALRRLIRGVRRPPAQRGTTYRLLRTFPIQPDLDAEPSEALDEIADADGTFGSYVQLTREARFRFNRPGRGGREPAQISGSVDVEAQGRDPELQAEEP